MLVVAVVAVAPIKSPVAKQQPITSPALATDFASYQRAIIFSRHRHASTIELTVEKLSNFFATYAIPGTEEITHISPSTSVSTNYILNHATNIPNTIQAKTISIQNGTVVLGPGR